MKLSNKCMLITYADSLGENLADLKEVLDTHLDKAVGGVHILPFFPSSADRGFAPMRYDIVDPDFGDCYDTAMIITAADIYPDKYKRYVESYEKCKVRK